MGDTINRLNFPKRQDRVYGDAELCTQLKTSGSNSKSLELEGVPPDPLPTWMTLPLEAKLPMLPCPKGSVMLFTTNIGETVHKHDPALGFDLSDPDCIFMSNNYEPLHDPHLKHHLTTPQMRKRLLAGKFITPDGKVKCTLKEYNGYRQYLRRINLMLERNKMQESAGDHSSPSKTKQISNAANNIRQAKVKAIKERLVKQRQDDKERYCRILDEDDERVNKLKEEQINSILLCQQAAKEKEAKRLELAKEKHYEKNLRRMAIIQSWIEDDARRRELTEAKRRQKDDERQKMLEQNWANRKRMQQDKIDEDLKMQAFLDDDKRKRIAERDLMTRKQVEKQQEQLLQLTQKRRDERDMLEQMYLKTFAARIEQARIASALRRKRREAYRKRRNERLRPHSNWDIVRAILLAIGDWGENFSVSEVLAQPSQIRSLLIVYDAEKDSQKSLADLSLENYKDTSFNIEVVEARSTESQVPSNQDGGVQFVENVKLDETTNHSRTNTQELYEILKSQRLKEEDDSNLDDVEKAAKAIVDMTVFLTTQVIYPAYLTYLREDHPDTYTQYFERPCTPLPTESRIIFAARSQSSVRFSPNIVTLPDTARDSLTLITIQPEISNEDITKLLKGVLDKIASGVLNADQAQEMALMAKQLLQNVPNSPLHSLSPASSEQAVSDAEETDTSVIADEIVSEALRDVQSTLFDRVMSSSTATDLARFLVSKAMAYATSTMLRLSQGVPARSSSTTSDLVNEVLERVVKDVRKDLGYNAPESQDSSQFVSSLIVEASSGLGQSSSQFCYDLSSEDTVTDLHASESSASQLVRNCLFKVVNDIEREGSLDGKIFGASESPHTSFAEDLLIGTLRNCIQELKHDRIPQPEMLQITSAILKTRPTLANGYYRTHCPLGHTVSVDDMTDYDVNSQTSSSVMIESLIRDTLTAVRRDLDNSEIGTVDVLKLARDADVFRESGRNIQLRINSSDEADMLVTEAIQNTLAGFASSCSVPSNVDISLISSAYVQQALAGVSALVSDDSKSRSDTSLAAELTLQLAVDDAINEIVAKKPETPLRSTVAHVAEELIRRAIDDILMTDATTSRLTDSSRDIADYDDASGVKRFLDQILSDLNNETLSGRSFGSDASLATECEAIVRDELSYVLKNLRNNELYSTNSCADSIVNNVLRQISGHQYDITTSSIISRSTSMGDSQTSSVEQEALVRDTLQQVIKELPKAPVSTSRTKPTYSSLNAHIGGNNVWDQMLNRLDIIDIKSKGESSQPESRDIVILIRNTLRQVLQDLQKGSPSTNRKVQPDNIVNDHSETHTVTIANEIVKQLTESRASDADSHTSPLTSRIIHNIVHRVFGQLKKDILISETRSSELNQDYFVKDIMRQAIGEMRNELILNPIHFDGKSKSTPSSSSEAGTIVREVLGQVVKHMKPNKRNKRDISGSSSPEVEAVRSTLYEVLFTLQNDMHFTAISMTPNAQSNTSSIASETERTVNVILDDMLQCLSQTGETKSYSQSSSMEYERVVRDTLSNMLRKLPSEIQFDRADLQAETIVISVFDNMIQQLEHEHASSDLESLTSSLKAESAVRDILHQVMRDAPLVVSDPISVKAEALINEVIGQMKKHSEINLSGSAKHPDSTSRMVHDVIGHLVEQLKKDQVTSDSDSRSSSLDQEAIVRDTLQQVIREMMNDFVSYHTDVEDEHRSFSSGSSEAGIIVNDVLERMVKRLKRTRNDERNLSRSSSPDHGSVVRDVLCEVLFTLRNDMQRRSVRLKSAAQGSSATGDADSVVHDVIIDMVNCLNQTDVNTSLDSSSQEYEYIVRDILKIVLNDVKNDRHLDPAAGEAEDFINHMFGLVMKYLTPPGHATSERDSLASSLEAEAVVGETINQAMLMTQPTVSDLVHTKAEALINEVLEQMNKSARPRVVTSLNDSEYISRMTDNIIDHVMRQVKKEYRWISDSPSQSSALVQEAMVKDYIAGTSSSEQESIASDTLKQLLCQLPNGAAPFQKMSTSFSSSGASETETVGNRIVAQLFNNLQKGSVGTHATDCMSQSSGSSMGDAIVRNTLGQVLKDFRNNLQGDSTSQISSVPSEAKSTSGASVTSDAVNNILSLMIERLGHIKPEKAPSNSSLEKQSNFVNDSLSQVLGEIQHASSEPETETISLKAHAEAAVGLVLDKVMQKLSNTKENGPNCVPILTMNTRESLATRNPIPGRGRSYLSRMHSTAAANKNSNNPAPQLRHFTANIRDNKLVMSGGKGKRLDDVKAKNNISKNKLGQDIAIPKAPDITRIIQKDLSAVTPQVKVSSKVSLVKKWTAMFPGRKARNTNDGTSKLSVSASKPKDHHELMAVSTPVSTPAKSIGHIDDTRKISKKGSLKVINKPKLEPDSVSAPAQKKRSKTFSALKLFRKSTTEIAQSPTKAVTTVSGNSDQTAFTDVALEKTRSTLADEEVNKIISSSRQMHATSTTCTDMAIPADHQQLCSAEQKQIKNIDVTSQPSTSLIQPLEHIEHNIDELGQEGSTGKVSNPCISGRISPDAETIDDEELPVLVKISKRGGISDVHIATRRGESMVKMCNSQHLEKSSKAGKKPIQSTTVSLKDILDISPRISKALPLSSKANKVPSEASRTGVNRQSTHQIVNLRPRPSSGYRKSPTAQSIANAVSNKELIRLEDAEELLRPSASRNLAKNPSSLTSVSQLLHQPQHSLNPLLPKRSILPMAEVITGNRQCSLSKTSNGSESGSEMELKKSLSGRSCTHSDDIDGYHVMPQSQLSTGSLPGPLHNQSLRTRRYQTGHDRSKP